MATTARGSVLERLDPRVRGAVVAVVATALTLVITQLLLPGTRGGGTPTAILFLGLVNGSLNALTAVGLIVIYRSHRIINFAQAAIGVGGGVFTANLISLSHWNFFLAFVAGILVAAILALAFQLVFVIRFYNAPRLVLTILTIAAVPAIQFATGFINQLPLFPNIADRSQEDLLGQNIKVPFESFHFTIGSFTLRFGFAHLFGIAIAILAMVALYAFFRFTRVGVAIRAAAENNERARVLGISVISLSMVAWLISGTLSGLGVILQGTIQRQFTQGIIPPELLVIPLAAAALAQFERYPAAAGSAVLITMVREAVHFSYAERTNLVDAGLFVLVLVAFLLTRRRSQRAEESEASAFESASEQRPIPKELLQVPTVAYTRRVFALIIGIGLLVLPLAATPAQTNLASYYLLLTISMLSLVVLTGWAGQVSLGQWAMVGVGAVIGGSLLVRAGIPWVICLVITPIITAGISVLLGFPALRIRGLFLAVATFAFAIAIQSVLFEERYFGWLLPGSISRPKLFFIDFEDTRSMYYFCVVALAFVVFVLTVLRRSRTGRILIALRENENNLRAFGVDPIRMRLLAFGISGFICGFAGFMIAIQQRAATNQDFPAQTSLDVFLFSVLGGVGSVYGALLGALYYSLQKLVTNDAWALVLGPVGLLVILYIAPGGLASLFTAFRDGVLKIIAQRRQMVVPALFADVDISALENRLIPLAEPLTDAGLDALPHDRRYRTESELYGSRGRSKAAMDSGAEERAVLGAAAESFGGED
jgi:branched-chain amino acid transport system permease protein